VFPKVREKLDVIKQPKQTFDVEKFSFISLSELEVSKQFHSNVSESFASMENINDREDIHGAWENIRENTKTSAKESQGLYEWKQYKPWFDEYVHGF
jgi:pyruvate formate-lyase activating enzyme-like uncharacterized protein